LEVILYVLKGYGNDNQGKDQIGITRFQDHAASEGGNA
jgi:hypothetical protein